MEDGRGVVALIQYYFNVVPELIVVLSMYLAGLWNFSRVW